MSDLSCPHCLNCDFTNGQCHCGCGEETKPLAASTVRYNKYRKRLPPGSRAKFISGHQNRVNSKLGPNGRRFLEQKRLRLLNDEVCPWCESRCDYLWKCHCGCGKQAVVSKHDRTSNGILQGMPYRTLRGHHSRKLSDKEVAEMRYLYATTDISQEELSEKFGVAQVTVSRVMHYDVHKEAGFKQP